MRAKVAEEQKNGGSGDMFGTWYLASHSDSKSVPHGVIPQDYLFRRLGLQNQSEIQQMVDDMCSKKGLSNDTSQRVVVLSLREFRALGIIRALIHVPTVAMLADGLTKVGKFPQLLRFCTTGHVTFPIKDDKTFRISLSPPYLPHADAWQHPQ